MDEFMRKMVENMDEQQLENILKSVDEEQIAQAMDWLWAEIIIPHLVEVRERAQADPSSEEVRQRFESMSEDEREEMFYESLDSLIETLAKCRHQPKQGFEEMKALLRDPFTAEALLMIFENEEHIDEEYTEQLKDFGVTHLHWAGVSVLPEMYTEAERRQVTEELGLDDGGATPGGGT